jgi:hypothetical protein
MVPRLGRAGAVFVAALGAAAVAAVLDRTVPNPSADVSRGSEEAFARGLYPRELPPHQPALRWTSEKAVFRFRHLPGGAGSLEVALHDHRTPVEIVAGGAVVGVLEPGVFSTTIPLVLTRSLDVELRTEGFVARDGRRLGAKLEAVRLEASPPALPSPGLLGCFLMPAIAVVVGGLASGLGAGPAILLSLAVSFVEALLLWPSGLVRSEETARLGGLLALGGLGIALFARAVNSKDEQRERRGPYAFAALLVAVLLQGAIATSPLMVVSDAVFHANMLARVAGGDFFPTSVTQHTPPFRFPYGVSFYALLVPLARSVDPVWLVRAGAALSGVLASVGLFLLVAPLGARRAALAVVLLQLLPETLTVYSYGNLSNIFGESLTALFFSWWAGAAPGGLAVGAGLLALGALGHFSSFVVLLVLTACLLLLSKRRGALVVALGLGLAGAYYATFSGLILRELPRLFGGGGGHHLGMLQSLAGQAMSALRQWGLPAVVLAVLGRPQGEGLDRDLRAFWLAGGILAVLAVLSPLDVRYLYALTLVVSIAAASGLELLLERGGASRLLGWGLLAAQAVIQGREIVEDLLRRYRPGA